MASENAGGLGALDLPGLHQVLQRHIYAARDYVPAIDLIKASPPPPVKGNPSSSPRYVPPNDGGPRKPHVDR